MIKSILLLIATILIISGCQTILKCKKGYELVLGAQNCTWLYCQRYSYCTDEKGL